MQGTVQDAGRGRVFTLLDVTWSAMRLLSLALGGPVVDALGIRPLFWGGGMLLALADLLGLSLLHRHDFRRATAECERRCASRPGAELKVGHSDRRLHRRRGASSIG